MYKSNGLLRLKGKTVFLNPVLTSLSVISRYINPFWLVLATNLATALYAYLFVPESVTPDPAARLFSGQHHKAVYDLYKSGGQGTHRARLWLYTLCFFLVVTVHIGSSELYVLYELSAPLCWDSELVGYGSAARYLAYLSSLLGLKTFQYCLEDSWVAVIGLASNIIGLVVFSVAKTTALIFTGNRKKVHFSVFCQEHMMHCLDFICAFRGMIHEGRRNKCISFV